MGQYYIPCVITIEDGKVRILGWLYSHNFGNGLKLMEHSYIGNNFVEAFESLLVPGAKYYKSMVVWAGDYADVEPDIKVEEDGELYDVNLYNMTEPNNEIKPIDIEKIDLTDYHYILNHTKQQYTDKRKSTEIHPLPLLTSEGNGRGGGDYRNDSPFIGTWARDSISIEKNIPNNFQEIIPNF